MLFQPDIDAILERLSLPTWRVKYQTQPTPPQPSTGPAGQEGGNTMTELFDKLEGFRAKLECPCCHENRTSIDFATLLLFAQSAINKDFVITSGYRCVKKNEATPGHADDSAALYGEHADIAYFTPFEGMAILKGLLSAGFERIRIYDLAQAIHLGKSSAHIHVDRHPKYQVPSLTIGSYQTA